MNKPTVIVIGGPTASGKSGLAVELAKRINGEIISVDYMQIYKYMNIGTAKTTEGEKEGIPHYLMDFLEPDEKFSVAQYKEMAAKYIEEILSKNKVPIMVGGTGLYINSVTEEINFDTEIVENKKIREKLEKISLEQGNEGLYEELKRVDKDAANRIHLADTKRIIRALEVYKTTGITITEHQKMSKQIDKKYDYKIVGLKIEREKLYERINKRVDLMVKDGLIEEAKEVLDMLSLKGHLTSFQAIGYKEFVPYFNGEITLEEALDTIKQESRRYAKRQITWFKRTNGLEWIDADRDVLKVVNEIIDFYNKEEE